MLPQFRPPLPEMAGWGPNSSQLVSGPGKAGTILAGRDSVAWSPVGLWACQGIAH